MSGAVRVAVLDYGVGNLHSAAKALERAGAQVQLVTSVEAARRLGALVVPGVGAYPACLAALGRAGGTGALRDWAAEGRTLLGICVGMQLFYSGSDEGPCNDGIGLAPGSVRRLGGAVKVPHIGWDEVWPQSGARLFDGIDAGSRFYFVHSFAVAPAGPEVSAVCDYGGRFGAAIEDGSVYGTQFHPEKSGRLGLALLANFVAIAAGS